MSIKRSNKFYNATIQYRADEGNYVILRMTYGRSFGTIKTATASDDDGVPVFPDRGALIEAMGHALNHLGGSESAIEVKQDSSGRLFGEIAARASEDVLLECLNQISATMALILGLDQRKIRFLNRSPAQGNNSLACLPP